MAAKTLAPKANDTYTLVADFGIGPGAIPAGQVVVVTGVHEPGTPGLGASTEDIVTAEFLDLDHSHRTIALAVSEFTDRFRKAK